MWIASGGGVKFVVQRWLASASVGAGDGDGVNRFLMVLFFFFCERICGGYCTERESERERERINKNKEMINK